MPDYQNVQFIGYLIQTYPKTVKITEGVKGWFPSKQKYLGTADPVIDITNRVDYMRKAVEKAESSPVVSKDAATLKIFVAPEFYFRGALGAYDMDSIQLAIEMLRKLAKKSKYEHWLFVFGSLLGYSIPENNKGCEVYNFCLIQKGNRDEDGAHVVMKEWKSPIDFIRRAAHDGPAGAASQEDTSYLDAAKRSDEGREDQKQNYDGNAVFTVDKIRFGVEICLDHYQQRLRLSSAKNIQFQLVPSAGMVIQPAAVVAVKNGYVFNVDGSPHAKLVKVVEGGSRPKLEFFEPILERKLEAPPGINEHFARGPGEVHIFSPVQIPAIK